jgi:hypothetical protein
MNRNFFIFIVLLLFISCENPLDCITSTGSIISKEVEVSSFDKIFVFKGVAVVITQGPEYSVVIQTGENIMSDISVKVENNSLILRDNSACHWVRKYGNTTVFVTSPNIQEIHSKTEKDIISNGILTYPILRLFSTSIGGEIGVNDFRLEVDNSQTIIENNDVSRYYIKGKTNELLLNFYSGDGRFEGEDLKAKKINIFHRGSNDMILYPIENLTGKMVSTGNVILKNTPPVIDLQQLFQGQIIHN